MTDQSLTQLAESTLYESDKLTIPDKYHVMQDNLFSAEHCSEAISISEDERTVQLSEDHNNDNNVKTVLGTQGMERHANKDPI